MLPHEHSQHVSSRNEECKQKICHRNLLSVTQAVANSSLPAAVVRTGRIEADAPSGGAVEVAPQGALPAGATISPTQVRGGMPTTE